jgi:hypothetical protein
MTWLVGPFSSSSSSSMAAAFVGWITVGFKLAGHFRYHLGYALGIAP